MKTSAMPLLAGAAMGLLALYLITRWQAASINTGDIASGIGKGAIDAAAGAVTGTVIGIGEVVGIPQTNKTQCELDLAAGRLWDASFSCPAGTFLSGAWANLTK
ncbi:hypothetical protein [Rhodocyclus gracilis]|uniref:Uncharacterized protein n=1 Tax=Rhodocyclus tenuis TaxID=1066 RepID=A0A6L5JTY4_RHOTE|nr:hypothetical protein [Rhodocyclus gracilis]MQY50827.1 hypothetical protein [Rhodocyclus gracilis]